MCDNNLNNDNKQVTIFEERKASSSLLRNLVVDFEEQLYSNKIQLKSQISLLQEKELELNEMERTRVHNLDLFSPIYSKSYDTSEIVSMIERLKQRIEILKLEQQKLTEKIAGLRTAADCIDIYIKEADHSDDLASDCKNKLNDKGLSILEAQEIERQRIARDLHDTTVQNLTSLVHKSELCVKLIDIDTIRAKLELNAMSNTLKMVINDMRGIIYNLKPMLLDDLGLTITVERYAKRIMDMNSIQVIVTSNQETKEILPVIKLTLFRIIQEACCNVIKHANASMINIDINYDNLKVNVTIKDNGIGFCKEKRDTGSNEQSSSFGLSIMKERISLLSGTLDIRSEKGIGTTVTVSAPLTLFEGEKDE
jgi:two-component system, NarL family, sensor histidine kinase DegS